MTNEPTDDFATGIDLFDGHSEPAWVTAEHDAYLAARKELMPLAGLLRQVDSSSDDLGIGTNSYRNPEGPEAWAVIERLLKRVVELEIKGSTDDQA